MENITRGMRLKWLIYHEGKLANAGPSRYLGIDNLLHSKTSSVNITIKAQKLSNSYPRLSSLLGPALILAGPRS